MTQSFPLVNPIDLIDSYYNIRKPSNKKQSSFLHKKSSTLSQIPHSPKQQPITIANANTTLLKIKKSISIKTQTKQSSCKFEMGESRWRKTEQTEANETKREIERSRGRIEVPRLLSDYHRLYQISLKDKRESFYPPNNKVKLQSIRQSPLKRRQNNINNNQLMNKRFNRIFTQVISPKFNQKLVELRRMHILNQIETKFNNNPPNIIPTIKEIFAICQSPGNRQGCIELIDKKIYVLGGRSNHYEHLVDYLDLVKNQWRVCEIVGYQRRSFHSSTMYGDFIYIVGGFKEPTQASENRKLTSFLQIINLKTKGVTHMKLSNLFKRSHHSSILSKHSIIITGGINQQQQLLGDGIKLCLTTKKVIKINMPQQLKKGFARHSLVQGKLGIYLIGGNTYIYMYQPSSQSFMKLTVYGKPLNPFFSSNVEYISKIDKIVVYGGFTTDRHPRSIQEILLFDQEQNTLVELDWRGKGNWKEGGIGLYCGGASTRSEDTMYVFGGENRAEYNRSMYKIDFNYF